MVSEASDHEEPVEDSFTQAQPLQEAPPILAAPQTTAKRSPLGEYMVAHAEESAQAEERWKGTSVDEWKAGAQGQFVKQRIMLSFDTASEMRGRLVKIIDFVSLIFDPSGAMLSLGIRQSTI